MKELNLVMAIATFGKMSISNMEPAKVFTEDGKNWNVPLSYSKFTRESAKEFMNKYVDFFFDQLEKESNAGV